MRKLSGELAGVIGLLDRGELRPGLRPTWWSSTGKASARDRLGVSDMPADGDRLVADQPRVCATSW